MVLMLSEYTRLRRLSETLRFRVRLFKKKKKPSLQKEIRCIFAKVVLQLRRREGSLLK